jgi:hypothetical protein
MAQYQCLRHRFSEFFFSRESLLRAYGVDARVCYLGIDTDLFTSRQLQRENMVVGVGLSILQRILNLRSSR